jgi:polyhydroxybutyrate depolymerase
MAGTACESEVSARPRAALAPLAVAVAVALAASLSCATTHEATPSSPPRADSPDANPAACANPPTTGTTTLRASLGGEVRSVIVHLPDRGRAMTRPLVLNLHGSGSNAVVQEGFSGMNATSDTDGFVVAYPQGTIVSGSGFDWNVPGQPLLGGQPLPADAPDDVAYLSDTAAYLVAHDCVNARRIYVTGFSSGARMASELGCRRASQFAAIAPVSGLRFPSPCPDTRPVPVVAFHGTADPIDPYGGNGQAYWTYDVDTAARRWADHDQCGVRPRTSSPVEGVWLSVFPSCAGAASVQLYTLIGGGHTWPGGPPLTKRLTDLLGASTTAINANALMWSFFDGHPLP